MENHSLPPLGEKVAKYKVPGKLLTKPGKYRLAFRMRSRALGFGDVALSLDLAVLRLRATASTPAQQWDGVHLWLRYQSERQLYAVSVARRDGRVVIKKKCPGGASNGGTYYPLGKDAMGVTVMHFPSTHSPPGEEGATTLRRVKSPVTGSSTVTE